MSLYDAVISSEPEPIPARPQELVDYDQLSREKKYEMSERMFKDEQIKEYLDKKWKAEVHNRVCFLGLYEQLSADLPADKQAVIIYNLTKFKDAILSNTKPFPALCLDFRRYTFKETREKADWNEEN